MRITASRHDMYRQFASETAQTVLDCLMNEFGDDVEMLDLNVYKHLNNDDLITADILAEYDVNGRTVIVAWDYSEDPDDPDNILIHQSEQDICNDALAKAGFKRTGPLKSCSNVAGSNIFAAEGGGSLADEFNDFEDIDDGLSETSDEDLDEDNTDAVDETDNIDQDEVSIETDNNIDGHYIAECDRCHGIFISAVNESDQAIEKITGTCPLCQKSTDQYLKWVIKAVEDPQQNSTRRF